jgi:small ligand-binding sensory domain FIST
MTTPTTTCSGPPTRPSASPRPDAHAVVASGAGVGPDFESALDAALATLAHRLAGRRPDVVCAFLGAAYAGAAERLAERLAGLDARVTVGVTVEGVVADGAEIEHPEALCIWAAAVPGIAVHPVRFPPADDGGVAWPAVPASARALVVLADPFSLPADALLAWLAQGRPEVTVSGGLASGGARPGANRLLLDGAVHADGAVGVALGGDVALHTLVSQGCRPVGEPFVVTAADGRLLSELAGAPAAERLREVYAGASAADRERMTTGLQLGIVIDEYAERHEVGGFLIRGVLGAQGGTGALVVGDRVRVGQTVQFQVRDAASADADLRALLERDAPAGSAGALLFTCNGRGTRLFGAPDHDAALVHRALGAVPLAGFFAAGEFGPVGGRSHLHGFTASLLALGSVPRSGGSGR